MRVSSGIDISHLSQHFYVCVLGEGTGVFLSDRGGGGGGPLVGGG
jgi:hypothetical protein